MTLASFEEFQKYHARAIDRLREKAHPERWELTTDDFAAALHRSVVGRFAHEAAGPREIEQYLESLFVEDMALAGACQQGKQAAWIEFLARFRPMIVTAARTLAGEDGRAQEIADALYADLYGLEERDGTRRSLFQYFHGRSSLGTWLRSVVARTFVNEYRNAQRGQAALERFTHEMRAQQAAAPEPADPERTRCLELLRQALSQASSALEPRERLRLSYYHVQQLTLAEVGRLLGEHESTVSRKLERTRRALRQEVERHLRRQHHLSDDQIEACYETAFEVWPFDLGKEIS